ncbi:hypothetical protein GPX89_16500 [Nocardia sp. ET3-3]|uniref:MalT-like TPR region domain-containing protein n=1 Tax=Nocardia terrae TaxID=2675851 RepID=A0A7K1UWT4_9NOCA|nr:hypothetical protein [Nocardia terrae]MVU78840.1 hypothetical protein [Nocardia terrae]
MNGVHLARESGSRAIEGWTLMMLSRAHLQAGDYPSAETTAREAIIAAEWAGRGVETRALLFLGSALRASGRVHAANFAFQQAGEAIDRAEVSLSRWEPGLLPQGSNRGVS